MTAETTEPAIERKGSPLWGMLLIAIGLVCVVMPLISGEIVAVFISWVILVSGLLHMINAIHHRHLQSVWLKAIIGLIYIGLGAYLLIFPAVAITSLTLLLGSFFLIEGVFELAAYLVIRHVRGAFWLLVDGLVALVLGFMIWASWPSDATWVVGTLVGINFLVSGISRLMISVHGHSKPAE